MKLIIPKKLIADPVKLSRALENALNGVALDIQIDFKATVQTWKYASSFVFPIKSPSQYRRTISTTSQQYSYVNDGTRAHIIRPKSGGVLVFRTPFTSKTLPNQITSRSGSVGSAAVRTRVVNHPGTKARNFDVTIQQKWDKQFRDIMQRAIDSEVE